MLRVRSFRQLVAGTVTFWSVTVLGLLIFGVAVIPTLAERATVQQHQQARDCSTGSPNCYRTLSGTIDSVKVTKACRLAVTTALGRSADW